MNVRQTVSVGLVVVQLWPVGALAQTVDDRTRQAARNLGSAGVEAYEARDYETASEKLEKAYRALHAPSLGLWSARALIKLDRLVEAAERLREVARLEISGGERAVQVQAQADAATELAQLSPQIPNLIVVVRGANSDKVSVVIDGTTLPSSLLNEKTPVNPGAHHLRATDGASTVEADAQVSKSETKSVELTFVIPSKTAAPSPIADTGSPRPTQRTLGYVALGVAGAGLLLGGVATGLAAGKKSDIDKNANCASNRCLQSESDLVNSYSTWRTVSSVGLISGVALAALGTVLIVTTPKQENRTAIWLGPGSIAVTKEF